MIASQQIEPGSSGGEVPLGPDGIKKDKARAKAAHDATSRDSDRRDGRNDRSVFDLTPLEGGLGTAWSQTQDADDAETATGAPNVDRRIEAEAVAADPVARLANGSREEKVAAMREIMSQAKAEAGMEPVAEIEAPPPPPAAAPGPSMRLRAQDDRCGGGLRRRLDRLTSFDWSAAGGSVQNDCDIDRLRREHERRVEMLASLKARPGRGGALLTGLMLVAVVAAAMAGLYVLHPQIISANPELAPALTEFVEAVDSYGAAGSERTAEWRDWLTERIGSPADADQ